MTGASPPLPEQPRLNLSACMYTRVYVCTYLYSERREYDGLVRREERLASSTAMSELENGGIISMCSFEDVDDDWLTGELLIVSSRVSILRYKSSFARPPGRSSRPIFSEKCNVSQSREIATNSIDTYKCFSENSNIYYRCSRDSKSFSRGQDIPSIFSLARASGFSEMEIDVDRCLCLYIYIQTHASIHIYI